MYVSQDYPEEYYQAPVLRTRYIAGQLSAAPFDDIRVRKALAMATDKVALAEIILEGNVSPATGGYIPEGMPGYSEGISLPFDPEGAAQLLSQAGYPAGRGFPEVTLSLMGHGHKKIAVFLVNRWRELLGIDIKLDVVATWSDGWIGDVRRHEI